ncbi:hypothetical protein SeMB42_g00611 [Synchytrium endobioticum]|uniref:Uncharacterized protein n=1 Tax=Synchytrium endobioticum TaxID=286115 RepID=A0A507D017_9FUNG|nr:hypothetical protein SeLEV6574_g04369 [Synchytrium endobioticum]TPX53797.1 hypothetical protein SeMB42_g00611 [Synchytrium endobioticum]
MFSRLTGTKAAAEPSSQPTPSNRTLQQQNYPPRRQPPLGPSVAGKRPPARHDMLQPASTISDVLGDLESFNSELHRNQLQPQRGAYPPNNTSGHVQDPLRVYPPQRGRRHDKSKSPGRERRHSPTHTVTTASSFAESRLNGSTAGPDPYRRNRSRDPKQHLDRGHRMPNSGSDVDRGGPYDGQSRARATSPSTSGYTAQTARSNKSGPRDADAVYGGSSRSIDAALHFGNGINGNNNGIDQQSQRTAPHHRHQVSNGSAPLGVDDMMMQLQVQEALLDAAGFLVLPSDKYEIQKKELANLSAQVASLHSRLALESRVREAALNLTRLNSGNPDQARTAQEQLGQANKKVDAIATELWRFTGKLMEVERAVLKHVGGVLRWDLMRNRNGTSGDSQDTAGFTTQQQLASAEAKVRELEHMIDMLNNSIGGMEADQQATKKELERHRDQVRSLMDERERLVRSNSGSKDYPSPVNTPGRGTSGDSNRLKLELATIRAELAATKDELFSSRNAISRLNVQHEEDRDAIEAKERAVANMGAELEEVSNQLEMHKEAAYAAAYSAAKESPDARRAITALQVEVEALERQLQKTKINASRGRGRMDGEDERRRHNQSRSRSRDRTGRTDVELDLARTQQELDRARSEQARTERELQRLFTELSSVTPSANIGRGDDDKYSIEGLVKQVNRLLADSSSAGMKHGKEFASTQRKLADLQLDMSKLRDERDDYRRMLDEAERKLADEMRRANERHDQELSRHNDEGDRGRGYRSEYSRDNQSSSRQNNVDVGDLRQRHQDEINTLKKKYELEIINFRERTEIAERKADEIRTKADKERQKFNNELDEMLDELRKAKFDKDEGLATLQAKTRQFESATQQLQQELRSAREKAERMSAEMDEMRISVASSVTRNKEEMEKVIGDAAIRLKTLEDQLGEVEALRVELTTVDREHQMLMARRETERREADALLKEAQDARDDAMAKMEALKMQLEKAQCEAVEARNRPKSLAAEQLLISKITELQSTIIDLREQKADLEDEIKEVQMRERKAQREVDGIAKELERITRYQTDFEAERSRYEKTIDKLKGDLQDMHYQVQDSKLDNVGGSGALDRYDGSSVASQKLRGEFKAMLADLRAEYNEQINKEVASKGRLEVELRDMKRQREMETYCKVNDSSQTVLRWVEGDKPEAIGGAMVGVSNRDVDRSFGARDRSPVVTASQTTSARQKAYY